jgi:1-phosphatidylinositol phosphodiesterase
MNLKLVRLICLLFVVNLTAQIQPSWYFDEANLPGPTRWMTNLPDATLVSDLDIPGTHDSGALFDSPYWSDTAKCQYYGIWDQLNMGVRYLDIRCRMIDNKFTIHHGAVYQYLNYDDVLTTCKNFLNANPNETIVMHVKEEHNAQNCSLSFQQIFANYVRDYPNLFYRDCKIPTLGEARGRIVLVRRFQWDNSVTPDVPYFGIWGMAWADNTPYQIWNTGCGEDKVYLQDKYEHLNEEDKWPYVLNFHKNIINKAPAKALILNYISGNYKKKILFWHTPIPGIVDMANYTNRKLMLDLVNHPMAKYHKMGVLAMDYINPNFARAIYKNNFWQNVGMNTGEGYVEIEKFCEVYNNTMENVVRVYRCPGMGSRFSLNDLQWLGYDNDSMNSFSSCGALTYRFWEHADFTGHNYDVAGDNWHYCMSSDPWVQQTGFKMSAMQIPSPRYSPGGGLYFKSSEESNNVSEIQEQLENNTKVYPNPANGIFNIDFASKLDASKIEIYNQKGSLILSKDIKDDIGTTIDITNQPSGVYLIKIYTGNKIIVKKIVRF